MAGVTTIDLQPATTQKDTVLWVKGSVFLSPESICQNNRDMQIGEWGIIMCQDVGLRDVALMLNSCHKLQYDLLLNFGGVDSQVKCRYHNYVEKN